MRSALSDRRLASGYLWAQLVEAAKRLWPDFETEERKPLVGYPLQPRRVETKPDVPFVPRWRRWLSKEVEDDDGGI